MAKVNNTAERAALAEAIGRLRAFDADVAAQAAAVEKLQAQRTELRRQMEEAEAAVAEARDATVEYLVAQARGDAGDAPMTVAQARARHEDLQGRYEALKEAQATLATRAPRRGLSRDFVLSDVCKAAAAVLSTSPALGDMHAGVVEAMNVFLRRTATMMSAMGAGVVVPGVERGPSGEIRGIWHRAYEAVRDLRYGEEAVLPDPVWAEAMTALMVDADAPVPGAGQGGGRGNVETIRRRV